MVASETGLTRAGVEAVFRALPVVTFPDCRKVFVRRADVERLIQERTFSNDNEEVRRG